MKIDKTAIAGMLAVSAAVLAGCDDRTCVDKQGHAVADQYCRTNGGGHGGGGFFYVGGMRGGTGGPGETVDGVARGGFGGEAGGHGGGGE